MTFMRRRDMLAAGLFAGLPLRAKAAEVDLPALFRRVRPSILPIGIYSDLDSPRFTFRGTGFVVKEGGHLLTNAHVLPEVMALERGQRLVAQIPRGNKQWETRSIELVSLDRLRDLALLRIEGQALPPLKVAAADTQLGEGSAIALIGFPLGGALGFAPVVHHGIVSAIVSISLQAPAAQQLNGRSIRQMRDGVAFDVYQLDATAYPGNSGGPVFDLVSGDVIAVLNMVLVKGARENALSSPSGISYAVPSHEIQVLLSAPAGH